MYNIFYTIMKSKSYNLSHRWLTGQKRVGRGFSLVELAIVVLITPVLAGIAVPIYRNSVERSIRSEAVAAMGFVKNYLNIYYGEYSHYPINANFSKVVGQDWNDIPSGGLRGTYFRGVNCHYKCSDWVEYTLKVYKHGDLTEDFWMNEKGEYSWEISE
ncbi:MAG: prepilin-type N-terminal cleavage/methylation domain-containing protein [Candidatus Marinimicrobia bacterium]|nr:prepilin-type N-terminal cleavage/methylation domain-containing protein [Candidatus Neomarinimicrobiota bacterium]